MFQVQEEVWVRRIVHNLSRFNTEISIEKDKEATTIYLSIALETTVGGAAKSCPV